MMAPEVYEQARANAPMHVQIWRPCIEPSPQNTPFIRINGRVVRIFQNRGGVLHWGQKISFTVSVISSRAAPIPMPSGDIHHRWERIGPVRFLEAFLEAWGGEIQLVHSQVAPIRYPTLRPVCDPNDKGFLCQGNL